LPKRYKVGIHAAMFDTLKRVFGKDASASSAEINPLAVVVKGLSSAFRTEESGQQLIRLKSGAQVTPIEAVFGGLLAGLSLEELNSFETYLKAGSKKIWATWKSCDLIASVVMDTPWQLNRVGGDGAPVTHPQLTALLQRPNQFETWAEFVYKWIFHIKLTGNAFWVKDRVNLNGEKPAALFQLNPKLVRLVIDPRLGLIGFIYNHPKGMQIPFEVNEVIHFKRPHPDKDFWGLGDIEAGENLFQENINRSTWSKKFWKNGASPSGILIAEDSNMFTDKTKFEEAKRKWQKEYGGADNSGKTAWLTGKWKYEQLGLSAVEMQHVENEKWNVESIFAQHGVPLTVAGLKDAANYATARQDDLRFRRYTVKPHMRWLADKLKTDLIDGFDAKLLLVFQVAGLTDVNQLATDYAPLFDRGVLSINEMRNLLGLPPKKDDPLFDQHFVMSTLVPLELAGVQPVDNSAKEIVKRFVTEEFARREA
jgi:HK97 family phage portal protein